MTWLKNLQNYFWLISDGILKTSEYSGVMLSEIIIGSNKLFNLVGFTITFLKLNVVIKSNSLLLFTLKRLEFRSPEITIFSFIWWANSIACVNRDQYSLSVHCGRWTTLLNYVPSQKISNAATDRIKWERASDLYEKKCKHFKDNPTRE
jgi:hypothetical protein